MRLTDTEKRVLMYGGIAAILYFFGPNILKKLGATLIRLPGQVAYTAIDNTIVPFENWAISKFKNVPNTSMNQTAPIFDDPASGPIYDAMGNRLN